MYARYAKHTMKFKEDQIRIKASPYKLKQPLVKNRLAENVHYI